MNRLRNIAEELDLTDLDAVIRKHYGLMYRYIIKVLSKFPVYNTQANADDVFQNTCILLMQKLQQYDAARGVKLSTFIGIIATHAAYDFLRAAMRTPTAKKVDDTGEGIDLLATMPSDETSPEEAVAKAELVSLLLNVREELPESLRNALDYDLFGTDEPDLYAEKKGLATGTVYSRRKKMQDAVRVLLEERYGDKIEELLAA